MLPPVQIAVCQSQDHGFRCGDIGRDRDIVTVADAGDRENVGFVGTVYKGIVKENHKIKVIPLDHIDKLLFSTYASGQEFVDFEVCDFFYPASGHLRSKKLMLRKYVFVGKAKVFYKTLFAVMRNETDVHMEILPEVYIQHPAEKGYCD